MLNDLTSRLWHTADDVAVVVLVPVSYVQQQVGAVGVGPVSGLRANHSLIFHLLIDFIEMQLSYTIDNTGSNQKSDAEIPVYTLYPGFMKCSCQGFEPIHVKTKAGGKQLSAPNKPSHIVPLCTLTPELPYFLYPHWPTPEGEGDLKSLPLWRRYPTERPQADRVTPLGFLLFKLKWGRGLRRRCWEHIEGGCCVTKRRLAVWGRQIHWCTGCGETGGLVVKLCEWWIVGVTEGVHACNTVKTVKEMLRILQKLRFCS